MLVIHKVKKESAKAMHALLVVFTIASDNK